MSETITHRAAPLKATGAALAVVVGVPSDDDAELHRLEADFKEAEQCWLNGTIPQRQAGGRALYNRVESLAYAILAVPAATVPGVLVKVRLGEWFADGDDKGTTEMLKSVTADLQRMMAA